MPPEPVPPAVSVTGLCQVCERERADYQCDRCGALVCHTHYDPDTGFCAECAAEVRGGRGDDWAPK